MKQALVIVGILWVGIAIPAAADAREPESEGEEVYRSLCWTCHGEYGRGDGPAAAHLARRPPDFTDAAYLKGRSDEQIIAYTTGKTAGGEAKHTPMAIAQVLKESDLRAAIDYIRTLAVPGKHVSVKAGRDIYNNYCWACHGERGDGKGPAAQNVLDVKPRDFTSKEFVIDGREDAIYDVISKGAAESIHGSSYMLAWGTSLSDQQIRDVIEYLRTFKNSPSGRSAP